LANLQLSGAVSDRIDRIHPAEQFGPYEQCFGRGTPRQEVLRQLGIPGAAIGSGVWIYWDYQPNKRVAVDPAFDTLVIQFADGKVAALKLADGRQIRACLAQRAARAGATLADNPAPDSRDTARPGDRQPAEFSRHSVLVKPTPSS
jgi:hypothetical protein